MVGFSSRASDVDSCDFRRWDAGIGWVSIDGGRGELVGRQLSLVLHFGGSLVGETA